MSAPGSRRHSASTTFSPPRIRRAIVTIAARLAISRLASHPSRSRPIIERAVHLLQLGDQSGFSAGRASRASSSPQPLSLLRAGFNVPLPRPDDCAASARPPPSAGTRLRAQSPRRCGSWPPAKGPPPEDSALVGSVSQSRNCLALLAAWPYSSAGNRRRQLREHLRRIPESSRVLRLVAPQVTGGGSNDNR
jgi:hypothetical protein